MCGKTPFFRHLRSMSPSARCEACTLLTVVVASGATCELMTCCENAIELVEVLILVESSWKPPVQVCCPVSGSVVHVPCAAYACAFGMMRFPHWFSVLRRWLV